MRDDIKCRGNGSTRARANRRICVVGEKTRPDWVGLGWTVGAEQGGGNGIRFYESVNNTSVHRAEQAETMTISAGAGGGGETKTSR